VTAIPPRILIVEDEFLVGLEMAAQVEELHFSVVGPAGTLEEAGDLLDAALPDAALLDINLQGRSVFPFARECLRRGMPFIFVTAYLPEDVPEDLRHIPVLDKPWTVAQLQRLMIGMFP
jgi:DNA-binding response OmpR family regulator